MVGRDLLGKWWKDRMHVEFGSLFYGSGSLLFGIWCLALVLMSVDLGVKVARICL